MIDVAVDHVQRVGHLADRERRIDRDRRGQAEAVAGQHTLETGRRQPAGPQRARGDDQAAAPPNEALDRERRVG